LKKNSIASVFVSFALIILTQLTNIQIIYAFNISKFNLFK